ncbi:ATP-binding protein [Pendulispora albinea]|uniref:ATP-binding protein n=1 Tax=Pendulispora albinea TaxID=2741071 RepID=A0ABZ2MAW4_9BACT
MMGESFLSSEPARPQAADAPSWHELNRRALYASLEVLRLRLLHGLDVGPEARPDPDPEPEHGPETIASMLARAEDALEEAHAHLGSRGTLESLVATFDLSSFERDVLLLAAGPKLRPGFLAELRGNGAAHGPVAATFELAFRALPSPHWAAATPASPLRFHHLIELDRPEDPVQSPLRIDERILFFLLGLASLDSRLLGHLVPVPEPEYDLPADYARLARTIRALWSGGSARPILQLGGPDPDGKRAIAAVGCAGAGLLLYAIRGADAQCDVAQRAMFARLIDRELALAGAALLIEIDEDEPEEGRAARALMARMRMPVLIARARPLSNLPRPDVRVDVEPLGPEDQRRLWRAHIGAAIEREPQAVDEVVGHFRFGPGAIRSTAAAFHASDLGGGSAGARLWEICRRNGRSHTSDLVQRIQSDVGWDDLILPEGRKEGLAQIAAHLVHKTKVYERWGFGQRGARGLGLTALFYGDSGTGKTLAAEVIANHVRLDLWRVDLSRVLDKYIGETEKNLRRIFDVAEESGAILLFDEADALFAKRTEVKDSVDRFANVEVSYLLQRMEAYGGLAILTTNMYASLDSAFMRRLRFVEHFPFPRAEQRARIWERAFPKGAPISGLHMGRLAQLNLAGGNIQNIAVNAAFLAAAEGSAITMAHVLRAARRECEKLERQLADAEVAGWI